MTLKTLISCVCCLYIPIPSHLAMNSAQYKNVTIPGFVKNLDIHTAIIIPSTWTLKNNLVVY